MVRRPRLCIASLGLVLSTQAGAQQPPSRTATGAPAEQARTVPNVVGLSLDSARKLLTLSRLTAGVAQKPDGSQALPGDTVVEQRPAGGQPIPFVRLVRLTVKAPPRTGPRGDSVVSQPPTQQRLVPNVIGLSLDSAERVLELNRLRPRVTTRPQGIRALPADRVTQQSPVARQPVPADGAVLVVVSIDAIRVPDVTGFTLAAARSQLARFVFRAELVPDGATPNTVFRQEPAPLSLARPSSVVTVYIAQAIQPAQRLVPNVVGRPVQDASNLLAQFGFRAGGISDDDDANVAPGVIVSQNPAGGQPADPGTRVALSVRSNRVRVPSLLTLTESAARQQIAASDLRVGSVETREDTAAAGTVIQQSVDARTPVERGSVLSIVVATAVSPAKEQAPVTPTPTPITRPAESTGTRAPATPAPTSTNRPPVLVPDIVGLTRTQARAVASRAGFMLILAPGQSARDADTVIAQAPRAQSSVTNGSLILMAEFNAVAPARPRWILWAALAIPLFVGVVTFLIKKASMPVQVVPFPPLTYAAGARPPTFAIENRRSTRGLELSLSVKHDPGIQAVVDTRRSHA
jgi:beta-lactam-binding protein with PASTA domain